MYSSGNLKLLIGGIWACSKNFFSFTDMRKFLVRRKIKKLKLDRKYIKIIPGVRTGVGGVGGDIWGTWEDSVEKVGTSVLLRGGSGSFAGDSSNKKGLPDSASFPPSSKPTSIKWRININYLPSMFYILLKT